ncbi:hypothetical protein ELS18_02280 [Clostridium perfringens]|uniref:hypothetical protein n=1 Tax=Clostridium perfringens TaxID=1502 RepID=UPI000F8DE135|nr:hypothetical protein [Clostridium perfringens]RUR41864.1 hypothetical protein ELS18_02280 [Clostridium perfringens]
MIKEKVKLLGINMIDLSDMMDISRPTLYSYINQYEKNKHISNSKYQYIFENLFNDKLRTRDEFIEKLKYYKNSYTKELSNYNREKEEFLLMDNIIKKMKNDVYSEDYDESIYAFINMIIKDYKKQEVFKLIGEYFLSLNSNYFEDKHNYKNKIFISNFYELMYKYVKNELIFKEKYYDMFIKRQEEIKHKNINKEKRVKAAIIDEINKQIELSSSLGLDINVHDILENIKFK